VLRKIVTKSLMLLGAVTLSAGAAGGYPERPIHLLVPYSTGGPTDFLARTFAEHLEQFGLIPFSAMSFEEIDDYIQLENQRWGDVITENDISLD